MNQAHRQQVFDTTTAVTLELVMGEETFPFSLIIRTENVGRFIKMVEDGSLARALRAILKIALAGAHPKVRVGAYRTFTRHAVMKGGISTVRAVEDPRKKLADLNKKPPKPQRTPTTLRKGTQKFRVFKAVKRLNRPVDSGEIAEKLKMTVNCVCNALHTLKEEGMLKGRKPKKNEEVSAGTRVVYEVAA